MSVFQWLAVIGALALGLLLATLWARLRERRRKAGMLDAATRGRALEGRAPALLAQAGYRVVAAQVDVRYGFEVDGQPHQAALRADFLAERGGRRYVVEVKSGEAARPTRRETRRQLLEYCLHYDVHGVLLLDAEQARLATVAFPTVAAPSRAEAVDPPPATPSPSRARSSLFLLAFLAGAGCASALWASMH